jgi:hypothetical protein
VPVELHTIIRDVSDRSSSAREALESAASVAAAFVATGEALLAHFVIEARATGSTWAEIGDALGVSRQAVHERFVRALSADGIRSELSDAAWRSVERSSEIAAEMDHLVFGTGHVLLALLEGPEGERLRSFGVVVTEVELAVRSDARRRVGRTSGPMSITPRGRKALQEAVVAARELGLATAGTEHLVLGLVRGQDGLAHRLLSGFGVDEHTVLVGIVTGALAS